MSKKKRIFLFIAGGAAVLFVIFIGSAGFSYFIKSYATSHKIPAEEGDDDELLALINDISQTDSQTEPPDQEPETDVSDETAADLPGQEGTGEPLTDKAVKLCDIYSKTGGSATFICYDAAAEGYEWEYYDLDEKGWKASDPLNVQTFKDELNREVSSLKVSADHELMVRCTIHFSTKENEIQTASLFILKDEIKSISVEDFIADANAYICARDLPVRVIYQDGSQEEITGLNDFYFLTSEEEKDLSTSISGNRIETTTRTTTECSYFYTDLDEEQNTVMRYRTEESSDAVETVCRITGKDTLAPVISETAVSPYEVTNIDQPVTLTVTISAEDDITPYPELAYAFKFAEDEPTEEDWRKKASFDVSIERNGTYIAYVRDQSGNISQMEKKIVTVDNKAPVIASVSLSNTDGWCQSNKIIVDAADAGEMKYSFENKSDGSGSDWITYNEYAVDANGIWIVRVRDNAGNITETEIEVLNIDRDAPVIHSISVK